jgi:asparagine synthase (glutamine-hydrolysing)
VKVALTGHGGDEVFAGYSAQFQAAFGTTASFSGNMQPPVASTRTPWTQGLDRLRRTGFRGVLRGLQRRLHVTDPGLGQTWATLHCHQNPRESTLLDPRFLRSLGGYDPFEEYIAPLTSAPTDEILDRCLYHDLRAYLPGLLYMEDRLSMAVSLESRVPLLDYRLIELMATVPPEQKVRDDRPKAVLRAAAERLLAPEVYQTAEKRPFPVPMLAWLSTDLAPMVRRVLTDARTLERGIFRPDCLRRHDLQPTDAWQALNIEMWFRVFIDEDADWRPAVAIDRDRLRPKRDAPVAALT